MGTISSQRTISILLSGIAVLIICQIGLQLKGNSSFYLYSVNLESSRCAPQLGDEIVPEKSFNLSFDNAFGACLIINDDNHLLAEWLAYHYHTLPMRRLIVGIDPLSDTKPTAILDRYRKTGLMKITEWTEQDIMLPQNLALYTRLENKQLPRLHKTRQEQFYAKCMAVLKLEGISWTAFIDTDEVILPNPYAPESLQLNDAKGKTVFEMLSNPKNQKLSRMIGQGCVSMHRRQFGHFESTQAEVQKQVPAGFNGSDFSTFRWRYHEAPQEIPENRLRRKCMVNLDLAEDDDFILPKVNCHYPIERLCPMDQLFIGSNESSFAVNRYSGSWEHWTYRKDFRGRRWSKETFNTRNFDDEKYTDDSVRPWLQEFVNKNGHELASYLLQGAGQFDPKPLTQRSGPVETAVASVGKPALSSRGKRRNGKKRKTQPNLIARGMTG